MNLKLNICHLYPDLMDTYGDKGNITTLVYRCQKRGIDTKVTNVSIGDPLYTHDFDFYFFGGGQDQAQSLAGSDLAKKQKDLQKAVENGKVLLSVCGGYQLLQKYFKTKEGKTIKGLGIFNAFTQGSDTRMMQNLLITINPKLDDEIKSIYQYSTIATYQSQLIGFENHSGKTFLEEGTTPLGTVIAGSGNNGEDKLEGAVYKNFFGCYLHGSLLPKNPHFADYLIYKALEQKYDRVNLKPLDDTLEWQAHEEAIKRL